MTTLERQERTAKRLAKATAPAARPARKSRGSTLGDGPLCPGDPSHGTTYLSDDRRRFYCVNQTHDLTSRAFWPNESES